MGHWYITECCGDDTIVLLYVDAPLLRATDRVREAFEAACDIEPMTSVLEVRVRGVSIYWLSAQPKPWGDHPDAAWEFNGQNSWSLMPPSFDLLLYREEAETPIPRDGETWGWETMSPETMEYESLVCSGKEVAFRGRAKHQAAEAETPSLTKAMIGNPLVRLAVAGLEEK